MNEPNAAAHLRLVLSTVVVRIVAHLRAVLDADEPDVLARFPVLADYVCAGRTQQRAAEAANTVARRWQARAEEFERAGGGTLPLGALARGTALGFEAQAAVVLAGCVEEDLRLGALFAELQGTPGTRRPCIGLLETLTDRGTAAAETTVARLIRDGWLLVEPGDTPRAEQSVRLPPGVWDIVGGRAPFIEGLAVDRCADTTALEALVLDDKVAAQVCAIPSLLARGEHRGVVVRGPEGAGRRSVVLGIARALALDVAAVAWGTDGREPALWRAIGPACQLARIVPLAVLSVSAGDSVSVAPPPAFRGFVAVVAGKRGAIRGPAVERAVHVDLEAPGPDARAALWRHALPGDSDATCHSLADRFRLTGGNIGRAAVLATTFARAAGRSTVTVNDVRRASGTLNRHAFDALANRLAADGTWADLVVPASTAHDLFDLVRRCRFREALPGAAGAACAGSLSRGVRALFSGPSGTGKTLAARVVAAELGMDVYRVDLSAIVSKYIGETEKNLETILGRAEELDVMLLLDEGDALMAGRTDVKSSNDRYANLETNFLLQRLEDYDGVIVITTNAAHRVDSAFLRRVDATIEFPPPGPEERERIWYGHLPAMHAVSGGFLRSIAARAALTGGQIRNAALHATLAALDRGAGQLVQDGDVEAAVRREFRKFGGAFLLSAVGEDGPLAVPAKRLDRMLAGLR